MKRYAFLITAALLLTQQTFAGNLLQNPGFDARYENVGEGKYPSFWDRTYGTDSQISVVSSPKMEGRWAAKLLDSGAGSVGLSSSFVNVTPGFNYTASVYAKCYDTPSLAKMYLRFYDSSGGYLTGTSIGTTSIDWTKLSRTMMAPEEAAFAEMLCYVCMGSETGNVYFDNASLVLADEILANGTFSGCTLGELPPSWKQWDSYNPAKIESYEDGNVMWLSDAKTYRSKGAYILLPGTPGVPYKCTFSAKKLSASNDDSAFYLIFLDENEDRIDGDGDGYGDYESVYISSTSWTSHEITTIAPPGTVYIQILPYYSIAATGVSVFKDIHVTEDYDFYYVSAYGTGDGFSSSSPASYTSSALWTAVNASAASYPVKVVFKTGSGYGASGSLTLESIGNSVHQILLKGELPFGTIFDGTSATLFDLKGCQNMVLENLNFTGDGAGIGYALRITSSGGIGSENITIRNCHWYGMESIIYGATGVSSGSHHVTYENCIFERIGLSTGSHMMYHAYDADYVSVANCYFEDCAGSYVRFRAGSDHGQVLGCTFVSTRTYANRPSSIETFVEFPVFNDVDPGDETFAQSPVVAGNSFQFASASPADRRGIQYSHRGFDPTGWNYLMTASEGAVLEGSDASAKKTLLLNNCGIDFDEIVIDGNTWLNETSRIRFGSYAAYGSTSKGWDASVDISDIVFGSE